MTADTLRELVQLDNALRSLERASMLDKPAAAKAALLEARALLAIVVDKVLGLEGRVTTLEKKCPPSASARSSA